MDDRDLVRMANQIAAFFDAYPVEVAVKETAGHMRNFWEPRMRTQYVAYVRNGSTGLTETARKAAPLLAT